MSLRTLKSTQQPDFGTFLSTFHRLYGNKPQWEDLNGPRSYDSTPNLFTYGFGRGKLPCRFYNVHPTLIG